MDSAASEFSWDRRVMHFLRGEKISTVTRPVVELAIVMEAGAYVTDLGPMRNEDKYPHMHTQYVQCVDKFSPDDFAGQDIRGKMKQQLYRAKLGLDGARLWEKYSLLRCEIRTMTTVLPTNLASMPSGNQLHDVYHKYICDRYRAIHVSELQQCNCFLLAISDPCAFSLATA